MNKAHIILGPTSSGKTTLALNLAKKHKGVLISADSRQIYKDMDIGTGKTPVQSAANAPLKIERGKNKWTIDGIDIWGYDLATPDMYFSAYDYADFAINKINELSKNPKYKIIIIVGGTGFYIDAITGKINLSNIEPDFKLRSELEQLSTEELGARLTSLNLEAYKKIDAKNPARLVRAIEKELNKNKISTQKPLPNLSEITFNYIGLTAPRPLLYQKVDTWLQTVWQGGLLEETTDLMKKYSASEKLNGIVYKTAVQYLKNQMDEHTAIQKTKYHLHAYIRRQQTYFKKNHSINWIDISEENTPQIVENLVLLNHG
jgi:tRNA dimethylallyltransferase